MNNALAVLAFLVAALPAQAQHSSAEAAARAILTELQPRSFAENREYCGYIGVLEDGRFMATEVTRGDAMSCLSRGDESRFLEIVASFHTHGAYSADADSEVPTIIDARGDVDEGVDGYVSTPGGRLWHIDGATGVTRLLCGPGCLPVDPAYVDDTLPECLRPRYTLQQLARRNEEC